MAAGETPALSVGVRLHDLPEGTVEERLRMAAEQGFSCVQLPSKVLYRSYGITRAGLTPGLAAHLRRVCDECGVYVAVLGCYRNLAAPEEALADELAEYEACCRFAGWLGGCVVGTETGRPNAGNRVMEDRFCDGALVLLAGRLAAACRIAARHGVTLAIEPGWNEVVCAPERCRRVLDLVAERTGAPGALQVIYDPVSLLHPTVVGDAAALTGQMLELCGDEICVLHAKDLEVVGNEDADGWCDGSGSRLVCHAAGVTGGYDFGPVARWAREHKPWAPCVIENSTPDTAARSRAYLLGL